MTVDADAMSMAALRDAMAGVCAPVSVVTAVHPAVDGGPARPHGTTVSAFTSLSMSPPIVLVSLDKRSDLLALIRRSGRFGLNVLAAHQSEMVLRFARQGADKFAGIAWTLEQGAARLPDVAVWVACPWSGPFRVVTTSSCWVLWWPRKPGRRRP